LTKHLARVNGQEPKAAADSAGTGQVALLSELVALEEILLNVLFRQANGKTLTAQEMQGLIDRADSGKLKKARERLGKAAEPEMQPKESRNHFRGSGFHKNAIDLTKMGKPFALKFDFFR
jgi:hypothetical protein